MYRSFFGLSSLPFKTTPELQMFYKDGSREQILEALLYTVQRGDGIVKVTGEVGSGKTMLLRLLSSRLPEDTEVIYINSPNLSAKDILLYICTEINIDVSGFTEKFSLTKALNEKLVELHASGKRVVMLIDEAQAMTFDALEEIRLLSNIETNDDKLLQMVLFGQPELDVAMENEKIRQIKSRISYSIHVPPLNSDEVYAYLNYRMRQAGYTGLDVFSPQISKKIQRLSKGLPRNINVIADKILMACFGCGDKVAKSMHLKGVIEKQSFMDKRLLGFVGLSSILIIASLVFYFGLVHNEGSSRSATLSLNTPVEHQKPETAVSTEAIQPNSIPQLDAADDKQNSAINLVSLDDTKSTLDTKDVRSGPDKVAATPPSMPKPKWAIQKSTKEVVLKVYPSKLDEPFLSLHKRNKLQKITTEFANAKKWLLNEKHRYVIQLSTRHLGSLDETVKFYQMYKFDLDSLFFLLDFNENAGIYRVKVFYYPSDSFGELGSVIDVLPEKVKRDGPYIVKIDSLKRKLKFTELKLKEVGIFNE